MEKELIRVEDGNTLGFGDFSLPVKTKKKDFEFDGDLYKVKTFSGITRLERNGLFVYESLPGTSVTHFESDGTVVTFEVTGIGDTSITLELESETDYDVFVDGSYIGDIFTNLGGKLTFSADLGGGKKAAVKVAKKQ
ncbi:MAG: endosialidase [Lachnospiraceae bacterium]|nr:endosialidase [Lachnospiraceae bacterium]